MSLQQGQMALVVSLLRGYHLCDSCLGRNFPDSQPGMSDRLKGALLRKSSSVAGRLEVSECYICGDLTNKLEEKASEAFLALKEYEFENFQVGATLPPEYGEREDEVRAEFKLRGGRILKNEITREVGKVLSHMTGKRIELNAPQLSVLLDYRSEKVKVSSAPIYLFGRYVKRVRGMPQKRKICWTCRGSGCDECGHTGFSDMQSVEGILANMILEAFGGNRVKFVWMGGEDTDSLVLGGGRPFYVEIKDPKRRTLDVKSLEGVVSRGVKLKGLELVGGRPDFLPDFSVLLSVRLGFDTNIDKGSLKRLKEAFNGAEVLVKPLGKRTLSRQVRSLKIVKFGGNEVKVKVECEGGISVKGLVGEQGGQKRIPQVTPNFSQVMEMPCKCLGFDVLDVKFGS